MRHSPPSATPLPGVPGLRVAGCSRRLGTVMEQLGEHRQACLAVPMNSFERAISLLNAALHQQNRTTSVDDCQPRTTRCCASAAPTVHACTHRVAKD